MRFFWICAIVVLASCSSKSNEVSKAGGPDAAATVAATAPGGTVPPADAVSDPNSMAPVDTVSISPEEPKKGESLIAKVSDFHNRLLYFTWIVNGQEVTGQHADRLPGEFVAKGNKIVVRVTPKTGGDDGVGKDSAEILVGNTPPRIASIDLVSSKDNQVVLQTKTEDIDGDTLVMRLVSGPPGMTISAGEISWTAPADFAKEVTFAVGASDGSAEYIQNSSVVSK